MLKRKRGRPRKNPNRNPQPVATVETNPQPVTETNPQPMDPAAAPVNQSAGDGSSAAFPSDNFEAVAAQIPAVIGGDLPGAPAAQNEHQDNLLAGPQPVACESEFFSAFSSAEQVKHWLDIPFKMLAGALQNPDAELKPYEREMFAPAIAACGQKYLPDLLRKTDKPELAMLGMAVCAYAVRVGMSTWAKDEEKKTEEPKKPQPWGMPSAPVSSPADSTITGLAASPVSSDSRAPGKVF
jgi:hypothetical protein